MKRLKVILGIGLVMTSLLSWGQKYGNTPEDSVECIKNLNIYQEFYKQKNYADAYESWYWVYNNCPKASINTYIRGSVILKNLIAQTKDQEKQKEYIQLLLACWDKRTEAGFGQEGVNMGRKAYDMMVYTPNQVELIYNTFQKSIELGGAADYVIPFYYLQATINMYKSNKIDKTVIIDVYEQASSMLEDLRDASPSDTNVISTLNNIEIAFQPYASCEDLIELYTKKFAEIKNDVNTLKKLANLLDKKDCTDSPLFFNVVEALHKLDPTSKTAYLMGKMCYSKKEYDKVVSYLSDNNIIKELPKPSDKINAYLLLANSYGTIGNGAKGREAINKALEINPNNGKAYIILGNLYAQSADRCGDEAEVSKKAAYWTAVDKYIKAKNVDPSVTEMADQLIGTYSRHFPSSSDLFMHGYEEGGAYRVGCWIQETTTIRSRR